MNITRRGLLGVLAAGLAPAIVRPASLMPLWTPKLPTIDGFRFVAENRMFLRHVLTNEDTRFIEAIHFEIIHVSEFNHNVSERITSWTLVR